MATKTWTGAAGDNTWDTAGNWSPSAPSAADDVLFNVGDSNVATGPASAIALASLKITPGYRGSFTGPVVLDTITLLSISGSGSYYNLSAPVTTAYLYIPLGCTVAALGGTWTNTYASGAAGGKLYVNGATLTNRYCTDIDVEDSSGGSASTIVSITNGSYKTAKGPGTLTSDGGASITVTGTAAVTTATIGTRGTYNHQSTGTISTLNLKGYSRFPCSGCKGSFTIGQLNLYPNAFINRNPPGVTVTISGETSFGYGNTAPVFAGP